MKAAFRFRALMLAGLTCSAAAVEAGIVVDHPPDQDGGWPSDTLYADSGGSSNSQRLADDFTIDASTTIRQVTWWGHYFLATPPANEMMRIRVYGASTNTGLPDDVLSESTIVNPLRAPTGLLVAFVPGSLKRYEEYVFQANLATTISLSGETPYWLEIVQIGGSGSPFVWESSAADQNGFSLANPSDAFWQLASTGKDLAFGLSTVPEPGTFSLSFLAVSLAIVVTRHHAYCPVFSIVPFSQSTASRRPGPRPAQRRA